jgi:tetratricopeptide (TPR) repeat protein
VALRTADWVQVSELSKESAQPAGHPNLAFLARQLADFAVGMRAVEVHDLAKAEESSVRFEAELWRMSQVSKNLSMTRAMIESNPAARPPKLQLRADALFEPLLSSLSVMSLELRASLLTAQGQVAEAKNLFSQAAQAEKALGYHEPPNYIRPVGETEEASMMAIGAWTAAKTFYEEALMEMPQTGFVLYGIAMCSEKADDLQVAAKQYTDFLAAWKDADPNLAQVTHARDYLAGHQ